MRKNYGAKPFLYPQAVFIIGSYDENGKANAMNAARGCIARSDEIFIYLSSHKTTKNILARKAFTVSMGTVDHLAACDYVGIVSADNEPEKMQKAGFHTIKSAFVDAPIIEELPMTLECKLISYDPESHYLFGKIVNVSADESILTDEKIDPMKLHPLTYDGVSCCYYSLGEKVGNAYHDGSALK